MSRVKIHFKLRQDEGFPPVVGDVWAEASEDKGIYTLDNIPFFYRQCKLG